MPTLDCSQSRVLPDADRSLRIVCAVAEELAASELHLRTQWRIERAMLLDLVDRQCAHIKRLHHQLDSTRAELRRYRASLETKRAIA